MLNSSTMQYANANINMYANEIFAFLFAFYTQIYGCHLYVNKKYIIAFVILV